MLDLIFGSWGVLAAGGAVLAVVLGIWFHGRSTGKSGEQARQAGARLQARETADEVEDAIAGRDAATNRERLKRWCLPLALLILTACTTAQGDFCDVSDPIRLSDLTVDAMSDAEVNAVLAHNEKQAALCGARPSG